MAVARARVSKVHESCEKPHEIGWASSAFSPVHAVPTVRGFESTITLPPEHMLSRQVSNYSACRFSVSARLLLRADGSFEYGAGECAEMKQGADEPYSNSVVVKGTFRKVAPGRITFWCWEDKTPGYHTGMDAASNVSFAQFMGVLEGDTIALDFPYKASSNGPWSLKGAAHVKLLSECPENQWRRWSVGSGPMKSQSRGVLRGVLLF